MTECRPSSTLIFTCRATLENDRTGRQTAVRPRPGSGRMDCPVVNTDCCVFHSWCQQAYVVGTLASQTPQKPGGGCEIRMLLDCLCLLHVFIYLVSLLRFRSVLLLANQEYRSPGLWFIREKAVIQTTIPGSFTTRLRV